jgi:phosphomannomutase
VCSCKRVPRPPHRIATGVSLTAADYPDLAPHPAAPNDLDRSQADSLPYVTALPPEVFKAYDIRGLYGSELDATAARLIGRAFARVIGELERKPAAELRLGLGRDMRLTAPELADAYRDGICAEGATVVDGGRIGTEMLYYLVGSRELDGGLMCTASHNPKAYTGAKLVKRGAIALSGDAGIGDVRAKIEAGLQHEPEPGGGAVEQVELYDEFQQAAMRFIDPDSIKPLRVVVDGGNGMAGPMVGPLLRRLGLKLVETYWTPDGNFPDHEPNPLLPENRKFIIDQVRQTGADLGIAWDGDADRCFFIDDAGAFVDGDFLTALLAESMLRKHPGGTVLYDVRASRAVADIVDRAGGTALVNRVGHAFFKARMREEGAVFAGEVSGHYYFRDFYCADSGTLPALLILELLSQSGKPMSELLAPLRERYFISGEINSEVADPHAKIEELSKRYSDARQDRLDGISVDYDDWHFNVRPSNTEPLLRLCLESLVSVADMERRRDQVLAVIRA